MDIVKYRKIECLYKNCEQLIGSGRFGKGLWPVDPGIGQFMYWLIRLNNLKYGLEVGAGVGISTAWLNEAFIVNRGKLISFEYFLPKVEQWERHMSALFGNEYESGVEMVPSEFGRWVKYAGKRRFDFVFFDQRKEHYLRHLKLILPKLKCGAYICADNVISHGDGCSEYLDFVRNDERFVSVCLKIGDGLELTRYGMKGKNRV